MSGTTQVASPRIPMEGRSIRSRAFRRGPATFLCAVIVAHGAVAWLLLTDAPPRDFTDPSVRVFYARIIETNNPALANGKPAPRVPEPAVLEELTSHLTLLPGLPAIEFAEVNGNAVRVAPRLLDSAQPPITEFARRGGLRAGESAFVVLRLQVMPGGKVAEAAVDVSSGSRQVDEAARAYGRATQWVAGRTGSFETATWVRLGVRLAA